MIWFPSHSISESAYTSILLFGAIAGLRALEPNLTPLWLQVARIPRVARMAAGVALPIWFSISQFGPSAAGKEVTTARTTLLIASVLGFILFHPDPQSQPEAS